MGEVMRAFMTWDRAFAVSTGPVEGMCGIGKMHVAEK
jgi:hypothetical protein